MNVEVCGGLSEQPQVLEAEDDAGSYSEREGSDLPVRAVSEGLHRGRRRDPRANQWNERGSPIGIMPERGRRAEPAGTCCSTNISLTLILLGSVGAQVAP